MVSINPTCSTGMSKLAPMLLSRPTGTNSLVLKTKAPSASAITLSQACPWVRAGDVEGEIGEAKGSVMNLQLAATQHKARIVRAHASNRTCGPLIPQPLQG